MAHIAHLTLNHLSYAIPNTTIHFDDVNLSFEKRCYGIVGDNGVGKTTLLKLLFGILQPDSGNILNSGSIAYCPQYVDRTDQTYSVLQILDIEEKWQALQRLQQGEMLENDVEIINDDWTLETKITSLFQRLELPMSLLNTHFEVLSGGQKTKILLTKMMLTKADFILLDEPTNNLDSQSKQVLIEWIQTHSAGFVIVSHDRNLLNTMDEIIEMTSKDIQRFGGNYYFYKTQKKVQQASLLQQIFDAEKELKQAARSAQTTRERHEQRHKKGRDDHRSGRQPDRKLAGAMKNKSGQTLGHQTIIKHQRIQKTTETLQSTKAQLEIKESIHADLSTTAVPTQKQVITIEDLTFAYPHQEPLFKHFNLFITGPERIAIVGKNGCGKSTLIKLICGHLKPQQGKIQQSVSLIRILDQQCAFLNPLLNLVENFQALNPTTTIQEAYAALASMQFRNVHAEKKVCDLSGGERIRAGFAISLLSTIPPQLIILDEPTNHLDLHSVQSIEDALSSYHGAMIVISHDSIFLDNIQITRRIFLS